MDGFYLNILGCGSATPSLRHLPSCQAIEFRSRVMLIDCGEGAQLSIRRQRLKFSRITDIFISHLHGDHFLGLPGLLSSMALHDVGGRVRVHIFEKGADLLRKIMKVVSHDTGFEIEYNILDPAGEQILVDDHALRVSTFRLRHKVDCVGFRFDEKPKPRHIIGDMVRFHQVPSYEIESLRSGADFHRPDGSVIANSLLTTDPTPSVSYAYCSDTVFDHNVAKAVSGVDLLYHEATYADDKAHLARERGHSTARQAGIIAREACARQLLIGHYSKSYITTDSLQSQAREEFGNVTAADEGMRINLFDI